MGDPLFLFIYNKVWEAYKESIYPKIYRYPKAMAEACALSSAGSALTTGEERFRSSWDAMEQVSACCSLFLVYYCEGEELIWQVLRDTLYW